MSIVEGNLNNVLFATALVPAESSDKYDCFFGQINSFSSDVVNIEVYDKLNDVEFTHYTDRDKGLSSLLPKMYPDANRMDCIKYLTGNIRHQEAA